MNALQTNGPTARSTRRPLPVQSSFVQSSSVPPSGAGYLLAAALLLLAACGGEGVGNADFDVTSTDTQAGDTSADTDTGNIDAADAAPADTVSDVDADSTIDVSADGATDAEADAVTDAEFDTGPRPTGDIGASCQRDADCANLCLVIDDVGVCTDLCGSGDAFQCPEDFACSVLPADVIGPAGSYCLPDVGCGALTYQGECQASMVNWCEFDGPRSYDCANDTDADGNPLTCGLVDEVVGYDCVPSACGSVDAAGSCTGATVVRCDAGALFEEDCADAGEICGYSSALGHHTCGDPDEFSVTGRVRGSVAYERLLVAVEDGDVLPEWERPVVEHPVRHARVFVMREATGEVVAEGATDDAGFYDIPFDYDGSDELYVTLSAEGARPEFDFSVRDCPFFCSSGGTHATTLGTFDPAGADLGPIVLTSDAATGAFHLYSLVLEGHEHTFAALPDADLPELTVRWSGSGFSGCLNPTISCYSNSTLFIKYAWADAIVLHEYSHYLVSMLSDSDSPGGAHDGSRTDPRLAWGEGFATYAGCAIADDPRYVSANSGGGWWYDLRDNGLRDDRRGIPSEGIDQDTSETLVSSMLWAMSEGHEDGVTGAGHAPVWDTQTEYIGTDSMQDRGVSGIDLVDFLDGWRCRGVGSGTTLQQATDLFTFPYDNGGPDACP